MNLINFNLSPNTQFYLLLAALIFMLVASAFFSSSEIGMMSINKYRLRHLSKTSKAAQRVIHILSRPDRLLSVILIGNTLATVLAADIAAILCEEIWGPFTGHMVSTIGLTLVLLIFSEISPKTLAAIYPEKIAFATSRPLLFLLWIFHPCVLLVNKLSNALLKLLGVTISKHQAEKISNEELKTIVNESLVSNSSKNKSMLLSVLDLDRVSVDDIMVPRNEIKGIDLNSDFGHITKILASSQHTLLPAYLGTLDNMVGFLHLRDVANSLATGNFNLEILKNNLDNPYFVPEGTSLQTQLVEFQHNKQRIALIVDEYGDIQGLITIEDILEEIIGQFTTDLAQTNKEIHPQKDGTYLVDGSMHIRHLNDSLNLDLPVSGPKTLNGLILDYLEFIPEHATSIMINNYPMEIIKVEDNKIKTVKILPQKLE